MASTLHQQLKLHYVSNAEHHEMDLGSYRIDAVDCDQRLIEIQCASLAAIRRKVVCLLHDYQVVVVKPLIGRRVIVKLDGRNGEVVSTRRSPLRESLMHVFRELVHFLPAFPHPRLQLDVLLTEQREIRIPRAGRPVRRRRPYQVVDRELLRVERQICLRTPVDLWQGLELSVPAEFTTDDLSAVSGMPRWLCQKAAYCFRRMQLFEPCGKRGNAVVYRLAAGAGAEGASVRRANLRKGKAS